MRPLKRRIFGLLFLTLFVLTTSAVGHYLLIGVEVPSEQMSGAPKTQWQNLVTQAKTEPVAYVLNVLGWSAFFLFLPLGYAAVRLLCAGEIDQILLRTIGLVLILFGLAGLCGMYGTKLTQAVDFLAQRWVAASSIPSGQEATSTDAETNLETENSAGPVATSRSDFFARLVPKSGPGGYLGTFVAFHLNRYVAPLGSTVALACFVTAGFVLLSDRTLVLIFGLIFFFRKTKKESVALAIVTRTDQSDFQEYFESGVLGTPEQSSRVFQTHSFVSTSTRAFTENTQGSENPHGGNNDLSETPGPRKWMFGWGQGTEPDLQQRNQTVEYIAAHGGQYDETIRTDQHFHSTFERGHGTQPVFEEKHEYLLPPSELLVVPEPFDKEIYAETVKRQAEKLELAFADFGLKIQVVDIQTGPVISQFELKLSKGLRLNKIQALADDLGIAMKVPSVRIVAPIPGKNTVGVEIPNEHRQMVRLRDVMDQSADTGEKLNIPIYLGKDVSGQPLVTDLTKLPHLLIAGRTGTGKSVCLNSIIVSMLMTRSPEQVRMLMIDPKMVELSPYKTIPHLLHPVVTDMRKAEAILAWAVEKMEERYQLLFSVGVRHLGEFNKLSEGEIRRRMNMLDCSEEEWSAVPKHLPYLVIIADEMADLMMTAAKEVETHIIRLAQKSRAVGIHLVLATQKPTVDIITGLIKSNLPARIAFGVATRSDSQVVIDRNGAERLLGNGDMLFVQPGTGLAIRGQGTYVSDEEIESIIKAIGTEDQDFVQELVALDPDALDAADAAKLHDETEVDTRDELYDAAVEYVIREGRGSLSLLQRRFSIGYSRAARLIDFMAEDGVVGAYNGSQAREVVMTFSDWQRGKTSHRGGPTGPRRPEPPWDDEPDEPTGPTGPRRPSSPPSSPQRKRSRSDPHASERGRFEEHPARDRETGKREVPIRPSIPIRTATLPTLIDTSGEPRCRPKYPEPKFIDPAPVEDDFYEDDFDDNEPYDDGYFIDEEDVVFPTP